MDLNKNLNKQQQKVLDAVRFFLRKGEVPTVREVGAIAGLRSSATALKHLRALEKLGLISLSGKSRGIRWTHSIPLRSPEDATVPIQEAGGPLRDATAEHSESGSIIRQGLIRGLSAAGGPGVPLMGAIAAGKPFESYSDAFSAGDFSVGNGDIGNGDIGNGGRGEEFDVDSWNEAFETSGNNEAQGIGGGSNSGKFEEIPIDPKIFVENGEVFALRVEGDSMIQAGILDGDFAIIRRQNSVEEGEIAAVIINGEGTLKRWHTHSVDGKTRVSLHPANERFDPIEITEDEGKDVLVFGKYVGLVRGSLRLL